MTNTNWLEQVFRGLATIDQEGQLSELAMQFANECRKRGLPPDSELRDPDADHTAKRIARYAAQMTGVSVAECERVGREVFRFHPRRDLLNELIDFYLGKPAISSAKFSEEKSAKPARRQAW